MKCSYRLKDEPNKSWSDDLIGFNFDESKRYAELVLGTKDNPVHRIIPWENLAVIDIVDIVKEEKNNESILSEAAESDDIKDSE